MRRVIGLVSMVVIVGSLAACEPTTITPTSSDPGYSLRHSWGPAIVIESGVANTCIDRSSQVSGREHLCRVIDGYETIGDRRNWIVKGPVIGSSGSDSSSYGRMIVLDGGQVFEGCDWRSPDDSYLCDYRMRKPIVLRTSGNEYGYVLRKLWDWTRYAGNTAGCAGGIAGLWSGNPVTLPILTGCADGPM